MLKTIKPKLSQIIQWSKKSHLLHIWFILCFPCLIITILEIFLTLLIDPLAYKRNAIYDILTNFHFPALILFIISILLSLIAVIIQYIKTKSLFVTNSFLLHNKYYNIFYTLTFIIILALWVWVLTI